MACVQCARIEPDELLKCEVLDFSFLGKDIVRNIRAVKRLNRPCKGLYFQINPSAKWGLNIGVLHVSPKTDGLTQDELFYMHEEMFSCKGSDDVAGIYFRSRKTPCADPVLDFLWACTLAEIYQAVRKETIAADLYAGIAHSECWLKLNA